MQTRKDTTYISYEIDNFYKNMPFNTTENGFYVAFGITEYDDDTFYKEDPDYGELKAYHRGWGWKKGLKHTYMDELKTEACTKAELHLDR